MATEPGAPVSEVAESVRVWMARVRVVWDGRLDLAVLLAVASVADPDTRRVCLDRVGLLAVVGRSRRLPVGVRDCLDTAVGSGFLRYEGGGPDDGGVHRSAVGTGWGVYTLTLPTGVCAGAGR